MTVTGALGLSIIGLNTGWRYSHLFPIWDKMAQIRPRIGANQWYVSLSCIEKHVQQDYFVHSHSQTPNSVMNAVKVYFHWEKKYSVWLWLYLSIIGWTLGDGIYRYFRFETRYHKYIHELVQYYILILHFLYFTVTEYTIKRLE